MGATFHFRCESCGLAADVSGGADGGFIVQTLTVYCRDCDILADVATQFCDAGMLDEPLRDPSALNICPRCRGTAFAPWNEGEPCPRCCGVIVNGGLVGNWD